MMRGPVLTSFSLTHVHYNPADRLSYLCAWLALVPQGLCVAYVSLIYATREAEVILMAVGQAGCEALNWSLKRLIKEERPARMNGKGYGMPSSHAQFVTYLATYLTLFLLLRHRPQSHSRVSPRSRRASPKSLLSFLPSAHTLHTCLTLVLLTSGAAAVASSRIYLSYHTSRQVLVGCGAGAACGAVWFACTAGLRRAGWLDWALDTRLARAARVRDLLCDEDLVEAGWARFEEKRRRDRARRRPRSLRGGEREREKERERERERESGTERGWRDRWAGAAAGEERKERKRKVEKRG